MVLSFKDIVKETSITNINVHLSGGHTEADSKLRKDQLNILASHQAFTEKSVLVLTGDFN
jgi:endonuclease/exonuclease/phosphatase family metal-dependent hydrolase